MIVNSSLWVRAFDEASRLLASLEEDKATAAEAFLNEQNVQKKQRTQIYQLRQAIGSFLDLDTSDSEPVSTLMGRLVKKEKKLRASLDAKKMALTIQGEDVHIMISFKERSLSQF
ncbi:hypothetical protein BCR33DRAFT_234610 [Rhizoclosmatium globosum]|uniref:Uncharacterized protein n=1 Tax=Rhizoclosmatium globosum TaxID=329046 RepID=A0A1Y2CAL2_9FUNG|nr:hypothetical protein BCR33DRAFT_234610 [Rhizoclosmatium globosum]|eukprot:ORY44069.1 hypothetical protein BCR33DRAFT_234610 [Rhizoclosmatium globosum]